MERLKAFIIESIKEVLYKVTWPAYKELQSSATLALIASLVFAIIIGLIDIVFRNAIGWFYDTF